METIFSRIFIFSSILSIVFSCSKNKVSIKPEKRNLVESVYASVIVQPDSLYKVYAVVSGILDESLVEEGDIVQKNESLFQIINTAPKLNSLNAKLSYELAYENYSGSADILSAIEDEILASNLKFKNDSVNFFRQKNLWSKNIGSKAEYDAKKLTFQLSKNNLQLLRSKYNRTKNELVTTLKQAQNNYKSSLVKTRDFTIKSKINGKVYALYKNQGEIVSTLEPIASIGCSSTFIIEMLVDEVDVVKISKDQEVIIRLDSYNEQIFKGKVTKIHPNKDIRNQTFKVEALFDKVPKVLYAGLSGEANIIISKKENVLTVPKEYLFENSKVIIESDTIEVNTGLQNMEYVEIVSGINENTTIFKPEQ